MKKIELDVDPVQDAMPNLELFTEYENYLLNSMENSEEALDFIFAKKCNLKVCSYCQTINQKDSGRCIACGKPLHRKWKS